MGSEAFSKQQVLDELERILDSETFFRARRMRDFLAYAVQETLAGRERNLNGYVVALEVFKRQPDFDPQSNTLVRVTAGKLRRKLAKYYVSEGARNPLRLSMPLGSYRIDWVHAVPGLGSDEQHPPMLALKAVNTLSAEQEHQLFSQGVLTEICLALVGQSHYRLQSPALPRYAVSDDQVERADYLLNCELRWHQPDVHVAVSLIDNDNGQILRIAERRFAYELSQQLPLQRAIAGFAKREVINVSAFPNVLSRKAHPPGQLASG